ncbi:hypothetical protein DFH06DRAFT_435326 [Mycena polygramma]|nr:hypothetical protein DFH06DRAFT_435326 [Mycena polygramma]
MSPSPPTMSSSFSSPSSMSLSPLRGPHTKDRDKRIRMEATSVIDSNQSGSSVYGSISGILGFKEKYSLLNCFVCGGALIGFCLARSTAMRPSETSSLLPPGEWFWFSQPTYKINLFIHIYLSTIGGIMAVLQFLPAIRQRKIILHRLNGYGVLTCLVVGNVCGGIVGRRAFGGELNVQSGYYTIGLMIVVSGIAGLFYVKKDTRRHRKWMLRMVVYFSATISARLIMLAASRIITRIGTYYSVRQLTCDVSHQGTRSQYAMQIWRCDEVLNILGHYELLAVSYPQCVEAGVNPATVWVAVHSSSHDGPLYSASASRAVHGMSLWIATIIHVIATPGGRSTRRKIRIKYDSIMPSSLLPFILIQDTPLAFETVGF